jgi:putative transposase
MAQNTVFAQIVKLIPRTEFESIVTKHEGNKHIRQMDCWTWFGALLFGQLTGHDSIRAIERLFAAEDSIVRKLGFGPVRRSTLSDANAARPVAVLEDLFQYFIGRVNQIAPHRTGFGFAGEVFALDSTTIELCLSLCPWARFHHDRGAVKLHTAIDIANDVPGFAVITDGRHHDVRVAKGMLFPEMGSTWVFDKGYVDYTLMERINHAKAFFVTRAKSNCQFRVVKSRSTNRTRGHICDQVIYLKSQRGHAYNGVLRRISYRDPDTGKKLTFLTNRFDLAVQTICDLYKARWKIELFFKTLKQNLRIKKFLGTSANSVKAQILVALIAYLLVQLLRYSMKTSISIPDAMAVIGTLLLLKEPLTRLLGNLPLVTRHPPLHQLLLL